MIEVRLLSKKDIEENKSILTRLMYMVLSENLAYEITDEMCKKYYGDMKTFYSDGTAILIGAFDNDDLIGFHWGYERNTPAGKRVHSYYNAIEPEFRGQGIANRFWNVLDEEAKKEGNLYDRSDVHICK